MNSYQTNLFADLTNLCQLSEAFYFVDQVYEGNTYRIFSYRLATYTEFQHPNAMECRGHTFLMGNVANVVELVSIPMEKFFNLNENPFVMNLDLSNKNIHCVMDKLDGSLISTVKTPQGFTLKSKTSLNSDQARAAIALLNTPAFHELKLYISMMAETHTINMEYTAPDNQIVIRYDRPQLRIINVRSLEDGSYLPHNQIAVSKQFVVESHPVPEDSVNFIDSIKSMKGIEGYVIKLHNGPTFKVKTEEYSILHKSKDGINSDRKLFEACVMETSDDLRGLFTDDPVAIVRITEMETKVSKIYNHLSAVIDNFYNENKHLDRKSFAIKGTAELSQDGVFGLVMNKYVGKGCDLKSFMIKNYKTYGIKDDTVLNSEE